MFAGPIFLILFVPIAFLRLVLSGLISADELSEIGIACDLSA